MKIFSPSLRPYGVGVCLLAGLAAPAWSADEIVTNIKSESLDMVSTDTETTTTFRGNVVLTGTNLKISCDFLEAVATRKGDPTATIGKPGKFRSLLATGNVRIIQGDREAACGQAEVLPGEDKIVLTDNPVVVYHDIATTATGAKITMLRGQRRVIVEKPSVTGPPIKDLGFDKNPKPAGPPPPPETPKP